MLVLDEGYLPALKALERLYTGDERWIELVDVYERQVGLTQDAEEAIRLLDGVLSASIVRRRSFVVVDTDGPKGLGETYLSIHSRISPN